MADAPLQITATTSDGGGFFSDFGGFFNSIGETLGGLLEGAENILDDLGESNLLGGIGTVLGQLNTSPAEMLAAGQAEVTQQPTLMNNGGSMANGLTCPPGTFFRAPGQTMRARHEIQVENPVTGRINTYRNMGRTLLFSGDLAAAKRVRKVAGKARSSSPRKRRR